MDNLSELLKSGIFWTAVAAFAASLSALFAAFYTFLTFRLVRSQAEPNVVVYVRHDESRPTIIQIVIENIGKGLASDIRFESSRPIPAKVWQPAETVEAMKEGPLIEGIAQLGPGDSRKIAWGGYFGLKKALGNEPIYLTFSYKHEGKKLAKHTAILEWQSFTDTDAVGSESTRIVKELEKIRKVTEKIAEAFDSLSASR